MLVRGKPDSGASHLKESLVSPFIGEQDAAGTALAGQVIDASQDANIPTKLLSAALLCISA